MTTEYLSIPLAVFQSENYARLARAEKLMLIDLYVEYHDTERFTIDIPPEDRNMGPRVANLLAAGLLMIDDLIKQKRGHAKRVFRFTHPALEAA